MKEVCVEGRTLPESYHKALQALNTCGQISNCSDWNCTQKEISLTMVVNEPLSEPRISKLCICSPESLEQYRQEMLDGILDFCIGHGWDYTYHDRMVNYDAAGKGFLDQVDFVIRELKRNPESRRAVIDVYFSKVTAWGSREDVERRKGKAKVVAATLARSPYETLALWVERQDGAVMLLIQPDKDMREFLIKRLRERAG